MTFAHTLVPAVGNLLFLCFTCTISSVEASLYLILVKIYDLLSEKWAWYIQVSVRTQNSLDVLGRYRLMCHRLGVRGSTSEGGEEVGEERVCVRKLIVQLT